MSVPLSGKALASGSRKKTALTMARVGIENRRSTLEKQGRYPVKIKREET